MSTSHSGRMNCVSPKTLFLNEPGPRAPPWLARDHSPGALLDRRRSLGDFGGFDASNIPEGVGSHASASIAAWARSPGSVSASGSAASAAAPSSPNAADAESIRLASRPGPETTRRTLASPARSPDAPSESASPPSARPPNANDRACVVRSRRACTWRARAASLRF